MNLNVSHPSSAYSPDRRVAVFPGSFDPLTNGHLDLIQRSASLFPRVIVAILTNGAKQPWFAAEERVAMVRDAVASLATVQVESFSGLLVDFCRMRSAGLVIRGLRSAGDYEFEQPMAVANRNLLPGLEIVFLMASPEQAYVSSRMVREIVTLGGDASHLVPASIMSRIRLK